jgi:Family of unknown function (DUF5808)
MEMNSGASGHGAPRPSDDVPDPQGKVAGVPYDFRRPTVARNRARYWNAGDSRILTPKVLGAGWDINVFWLAHPVRYLRGRGQKE